MQIGHATYWRHGYVDEIGEQSARVGSQYVVPVVLKL
jgi:hypothetical protein